MNDLAFKGDIYSVALGIIPALRVFTTVEPSMRETHLLDSSVSKTNSWTLSSISLYLIKLNSPEIKCDIRRTREEKSRLLIL